MGKYPKDCSAKAIGRRARAIFPNKIDVNFWEFHEQTCADNGTDMIIEYIEDNEFKNYIIFCQIKGTTKLDKYIVKRNCISSSVEIKTINYALNSKNAFIFVIVDVKKEIAYYLPIQDFFIANSAYFNKLEKNNRTINLKIPLNNIVSDNDLKLKEIAKSTYIKDSVGNISKICS